jgi:hypothetical protein
MLFASLLVACTCVLGCNDHPSNDAIVIAVNDSFGIKLDSIEYSVERQEARGLDGATFLTIRLGPEHDVDELLRRAARGHQEDPFSLSRFKGVAGSYPDGWRSALQDADARGARFLKDSNGDRVLMVVPDRKQNTLRIAWLNF